MFDYTTHVVMHREGVEVAAVVTRLSTTLDTLKICVLTDATN